VNVVFATTVLPTGRSGGELVSRAFMDAMRGAGHDVTPIGFRRAGDEAQPAPGEVVAEVRPIETSRAPLRAAGWLAGALLRREPYIASKFRSRAYRAALARAIEERRPSLVVIDHAGVAPLRRELPAGLASVYLAHNVEHELYAGLAADAGGVRRRVLLREAEHIRRVEAELARAVGEVWALSAGDAAALEALGAAVTRTFAAPAAAATGEMPEPEVDVGLLGTWTWDANAAGLDWFRREVLPALPPQVTVAVAGAGSERLDGMRPGASARGMVPDALAFLRSARVVAVPSVAGAGVQIKTLDAIASRRAVVATSVAVRGLAELPPTVTVADDPREFAAAVADAAGRDVDHGAAAAAAAWVEARRRAFDDHVGAATVEAAARA
jgi:hypothetical protein